MGVRVTRTAVRMIGTGVRVTRTAVQVIETGVRVARTVVRASGRVSVLWGRPKNRADGHQRDLHAHRRHFPAYRAAERLLKRSGGAKKEGCAGWRTPPGEDQAGERITR